MTTVMTTIRGFLGGRTATGPLSLRANFSWTFVGNVVYAACQWGMLTALAKLGTPEMVGQFALGLAVTAPVMMFANLQLRQIQATDARREYGFADYLALRLITGALAFLIIAGIALLAGYRTEMVLIILALGLYKAVQCIGDVFHGLMQQRERMDYIARALLLKGPLSLLVLGALVYLTRSVAWAGLGLVAVYLAVLLAYELRSARLLVAGDRPGAFRPRWQPRRLAALAWLALPLGFATMLTSLNTNIPSYTIERVLSEADLGFFAAMAYVKTAGMYVVAALGQSASYRLAEYHTTGQMGAFTKLMARLLSTGVALGFLGIVGAWLWGQPLLTLLYGPEYAQHLGVFVTLMAAAGFTYVASFLGYGMTAVRCLRPALWTALVTITITLFGCALLLPHIGLLGAATALLISAIVNVGLRSVLMLKAVGYQGRGEQHSRSKSA